MPLQVFPLTGGLNQQIDVRLLPDGVLSNAVNCELERIGRLVPRAKYTAIASTTYGSGTFTGYDLFAVDDRLFALGDRLSQSFPTDIFEYVPSAGAAVWTPTSRSSLIRLPFATEMREIGRPPDISGGVSSYSIAVLSGYVCLAYQNNDPSGTKSGYVEVFLAARDQSLYFDDITRYNLKAIALSDRFIIIGTNALDSAIGASRFIVASDESVASVSSTLYTGLGTISVFTACKVTGSDEFVIVANAAGTVITRRFSSAGVLQNPSGGAYANITAAATALAVEASSTDNQITVAMVVGGEARLFSYNLSTGASLFGPVVPSVGTAVNIALVRSAADLVYCLLSNDNAAADTSGVQAVTFVPSTGTATVSWRAPDCKLTSTPARSAGGVVFAFRYGDGTTPSKATNVLYFMQDTALAAQHLLLAAKDLETAGAPGYHLPEIVQDASTGKWYWANSTINPDAEAVPGVTEFELGSTDRRQVAIHGNHAYIGGALPLVFDQRFVCELGFTERPRIVSLTGTTSGSLLAGATYKYRTHQEWIDALGDVHLSPPSEISEVTLSASQNKVTAVTSSSHGLRQNRHATTIGINVRQVISRTLATATLSAAIVIGAASINPPSSSLNGLTLKLTAGGSSFTVTFTGAATTQATVLSEINTVVSSEVTATAPNGLLVLTSVDTGDGATLQITDGTANEILGLTEGETQVGETERSVGENFQRADTSSLFVLPLTLFPAPGTLDSIADTRKDESDPIVDSDLIRQQVLYSQGVASGGHHAPPPSDCIWAGKERLGFFRQHVRSRWTVSKLIVPAEPAECAALGFLQFSGLVNGEIEAGAFVGGAMVLWTRKQIWLVTGDGPRRNGVGEFNQADCITRSIGMIADGWMSMVQDDEGVWFQGSDSELYRMGNGGNLEWLGKPVREYLSTYPVIKAAAYRQKKREVAFAITNSAGNAGGILRRNALVPEQPAWFFDDVGAVSSLSDYQGRLAYVQSGTVYLQDASPGSGTFPTVQLDSGLFQGFQQLGYGALEEVGLLCTFRGRCTVTLKIGTDGTTFPDTIASWALTTSEYSVGQRFALLVDPPLHQYDQFALRAEISDATGTTEGVWVHAFAVKTEQQPDFVRLPASRRL